MQRENFGSRLGFILISAGCAIGLGNVWRFPYIVGQYGGAAFILIYLAFLIIFGLPIMTMEFSVGRASRKSISESFKELEPKGTKWHWFSKVGVAGNYLLMMFYTTVIMGNIRFIHYIIAIEDTTLTEVLIPSNKKIYSANEQDILELKFEMALILKIYLSAGVLGLTITTLLFIEK